MKKIIDLTNKSFNKILVLERDLCFEEKRKKQNDKDKKIYWKCRCHCGKIFTTSGNNLKSGNTKSCGCFKTISMSKVGKLNSKTNEWKIYGNIMICLVGNNQYFFIDAEDYEKVKKYCWRIGSRGYVVANSKDTNNNTLMIHRIILNALDNEIVDHKYWNKLNNCKYNLRKCTKSQNNENIKRKVNNKSGYTGVKQGIDGKWKSQISHSNKRIHLGTFNSLEEAVKVRYDAEIKIHKEFNGELNRNDIINFYNESIGESNE